MQTEVLSHERLRRRFANRKSALLGWISFEQRSIEALSLLGEKSSTDIFVLRYADVEYEIRSVLNSARKAAGKRLKNDLVLDRSDQFKTFGAIDGTIEHLISKYQKVYIDISCFPREALLMLVYVLSRRTDADAIAFVYNIAVDYSINEHGRQKWLGRGMKKISQFWVLAVA